MAEITSTGIVGKSLNDYLAEIQGEYLAIDPQWNIDNDSPDGQVIGITAESFTNLDESIVAAYRSKDPDSAVGEALNDIGKITGTQRKAATYSVAPITVTGVSGTTIPALSQVRSRADNTVWATNSAITIGVSGTATGFVTCTTSGRVPAAIGDLSIIGTNIAGWSSVTNPNAATNGEPAETNAAFRQRRSDSVSLPGNNMLDNMYANVAAVPDVTDVRVLENDSIDPTDANGLPYHSISIIVNGGTDAEVALAIYQKKNPGAPMFPRWNGETSAWIDPPGTNGVHVDVVSPVTGNIAPITFQRAIAKQIYVALTYKKIGNLPSDIDAQLKQAIVDDSNKVLFGDDTNVGFNLGGYSIGEIVPVGRLYTPVNKVLGKYGDSYVVSLQIGLSAGSTSTTPIQPAYNELAEFSVANIAVTAT